MTPLLTLQDFEFLYPDVPDLDVGMEQYNQFRFIRENHVFRAPQIGYRISRIDQHFQLGFGSLLHILDNAMYPVMFDVPRVDENPLIANEQYKKWIYHVRGFCTDGPLQPWDEKYIYRLAGLNTSLMRFKSQQKTNFRYITNVMDIPRKKESLTIINHNPLFRAYVFGKLKYYRKVQLILASVINTVLSLPVDKLQYIHIPLTPNVFPKESFFKSKTRWDISSIKHPDSFHWIVMAHLLNFWDTKCDTSWFEAIPQERWKDINFILTVPGPDAVWNGMFVNLGQIAELNAKNRYYVRLVNHINTLASSGYIPITALQDKMHVEVVTSAIDEMIPTTPTTDTVPVASTVAATDAQVEETSLQEEATLTEITKEHRPVTEPEVAVPVKPIIPTVVAPLVAKVIAPLAPVISRTDVRSGVVSAATAARIHAAPLVKNITEVKAPVLKEAAPVALVQAYEHIQARDERTKSFIEAQESLTPKQKERCERLAKEYKDVVIHGRRIEDILLQDSDMSLEEPQKEAIVKNLPDKSMETACIMSFDDTYMKKTYTKDLVGVVTSFTEQGMFLTDIEETPLVNELSHTMQYKLNYEDYTGKKHTFRFSVPMVNKDGTCLINGTQKVLKKQMLTLPICKTSPTRVSLSSNFNKTIVERNSAKAHSFLPYMIRAISLGGPLIQATYGNLELNVALSYDYATLATKYREVELSTIERKNMHLCFDYYNRFTLLFGDDKKVCEQVSAHEKQYGICLAIYDKHIYGYVNDTNVITWIDGKTDTALSAMPASIPAIFQQYYPEDLSAKMGAVEEWTNLKILDKHFPIMFILCYKYGLMETLKHLGVSYTIIGKRTTEIYETLTELNGSVADEHSSVSEIDGQSFKMLPGGNIKVATESLSLNAAGVPHKLPKYFHITPYNLGEEVTMIAKVPGGSEHFGYAEDGALPRICVSTAIDGAIISLRRVRFNKAAFEDLGYVDMFVYGYDGPKDQSKIITTKELTKKRLVYDAHVTQETWITENTRVVKIGAIRVYNHIKYEVKYTDFDMRYNAKKYETACLKWEWIPIEKCTALPLKEEPVVATEGWWNSNEQSTVSPQYQLNSDTYPKKWNSEQVFLDTWHRSTTTDSRQAIHAAVLAVFTVCKKPNEIVYTRANHMVDIEKYCPGDKNELKYDYPSATSKQKHQYEDASGVYRDSVLKNAARYKTSNPKYYAYLVRHVGMRVYYVDAIMELLTSCKGMTVKAAKSYIISLLSYNHMADLLYRKEKEPDKIRYTVMFLSYLVTKLYVNTGDMSSLKKVMSHRLVTKCIGGSRFLMLEKCYDLLQGFGIEGDVPSTEALQARPHYEFQPDDIVIKFKDCRLVVNRYPLKHSLIVSGLAFFDTAQYFIEDLDQQDAYFSLLLDKHIRINYLKGIDAFFQFFVDDITRDVLEQMNEPTNVRDLLIRSTELLTTLDHREASSMANHRIRSYEQFNAIVYNEMSRQMASYMVRQNKGNTFSINPEAIYQRIIKNESFAIMEKINPIHDLKEQTSITYAGMGGRTAQSFVVDDRRYPKDGVGIMSEATVDNGKVAINACLSVDPSVLNTRGILMPKADPDDNAPTQILSPTALLMPCSTNDDQQLSCSSPLDLMGKYNHTLQHHISRTTNHQPIV